MDGISIHVSYDRAMCVTRLYRSLIMIKDIPHRQKSQSNAFMISTSRNPNNTRTQSQTVERLTISFPEPESNDAKDVPLKREKSADMATFGGHDAV